MPPVIDPEKCVGCGGCVFQCGVSALRFDPDGYKAYVHAPKKCVDCFICENYCYKNAITIRISRGKAKWI